MSFSLTVGFVAVDSAFATVTGPSPRLTKVIDVSILPNDQHETYKLKISTGAAWTFLADEQLVVQSELDIRGYTDTHHPANVPHTLVLGPGLVIDKIYNGYWFWGRPSIYDLWADLRDLSMRIRPDFDPLVPAVRDAWLARP